MRTIVSADDECRAGGALCAEPEAGKYFMGEPAYRAFGPTEEELELRDDGADEDDDARGVDGGRGCMTVVTDT